MRKLSAAQIARRYGCSLHKVDYWLKQYVIAKRSISEAVYAKRNPGGDPFVVRPPRTIDEAILFGLGVGLYWGEGTKSNKLSIRLGNTDVALIKKFIQFLVEIYGVKKTKLRFGLQTFNDVSPRKALTYWKEALGVSQNQFQKIITSVVRGKGSYTNKSKHGVLTVYCNNKKLRDILCGEIEKMRVA